MSPVPVPEIAFAVAADEHQPGTDEVRVFTTRPDTLFGATFMVLAPETSRETVGVLGERVRSTVAEVSAAAGEGMPAVTVSIGIATTESVRAATHEQLVQLADEALYRAKREGRDRVVLAEL